MSEAIELYSSEYIMNTPMQPLPFIVYKLLYPGLYLLAGAPKIGKSWLALDLCLSVASGEQFLKHDTSREQVVYLSLEDTLLRLQNRLYELTDEPQDELHFAIRSGTIGSALEQQIEECKAKLPALKLVVIDTLQKIREATDISYGSDYKELSSLKVLADRLQICILLIHHTRKCRDDDPFNRISGSTGLMGCVDGAMVMIERKRGSGKAILHCTGRDIEPMELNLLFQNCHWTVENNVPVRKPDRFAFAIHDLMMNELTFRGTAAELCKLLYQRFALRLYPNHVTRDLVQHTDELKQYGVLFRMHRSHGIRYLYLEYDAAGDSSAGVRLYIEVAEATGTRKEENVYPALI